MKDGKAISLLVALAIFFAYIMRRFLGKISSFFFVSVDNLLFVSHGISPVLMWALLGLLVGIVYGSYIAIKKYRLDIKLLIMPIIILTVGMMLLQLVSYINRKFNKVDSVEFIETKGKTDIKDITKGSSSVYGFDQNLIRGIRAVEAEEYKDAEFFFKKAAALDKNDTRLDSLAHVYSQIANNKCLQFSADSELKYIPNYYYKYAAALTGKSNPKVCK